MPHDLSPGVYISEAVVPPALTLLTGVPVFIGHTIAGDAVRADLDSLLCNGYQEFAARYGNDTPQGYLQHAVQGFFQNGGKQCYVVPLKNDSPATLKQGLEALEVLEDTDLVCAPDLMLANTDPIELQRLVLDHCEKTGDRFAILDALPLADVERVIQQRLQLKSDFGALYFPWLKVKAPGGQLVAVPPCGHVAGNYAACDATVGVHKAPANVPLNGCYGSSIQTDKEILAVMTQQQVNCISRYSLQSGLRVWGARTLSGSTAWRYINVKRLFITVGRWCRRNMIDLSFETNTPRLWSRVERALTAYLTELYLRGALKGRSPKEAFYVKCNAASNSAAALAEGRLVTDIGLAPAMPNEFVSVQIIHSQAGVYLSAANRNW